ncbi:MAG: hypothetical protein HY332_18930 [Chloroflexi bacterium]|nr:hypothetical protein [Chloroflexota bacterium]
MTSTLSPVADGSTRRVELMQSLRETLQSLRASPVFALAVLVTLGLAGLYGLMIVMMQVQPGFMGMAHFTQPSHRMHDLTFGFIFVPTVVGMLAQLRRPSKNVGGMVMALIPWVGLLLAAILSADVARVILYNPSPSVIAMTVIAALLHPTGRGFFRSFSVSRVSWVLLALVAVAAVPLLAYAATNIGLQATVPDDHAGMGHYGFIAAFGFTVVGVGILASLRPDGWWLPAWVAGLLPALLGLASLVYPDVSSTLGPVWGLAAIAWGVAFVAAAELTQDAERPTLLGSLRGSRGVILIDGTGVRPAEDRPPGTPRWANVAGIIAIGLVLVYVILPFTGGRPGGTGGHTPPVGGAQGH